MLQFLTLKPEVFGLDVSDLSLKIVKLEKRANTLSLASFGEASIKPGIIEKGEIKDEDSLSQIIKEAIAKVKGKEIKTRYVACSLPEENSFLQVIQMPSMKEAELKKAVSFEAENYIPFSIEEVYLDSQQVERDYNNLNTIDVLLAAIPKKIVDPYVSCFKKAGLVPWVFEIESQAIARAVVKDSVSSFPLLLIDLGAVRTSLIIFSGHSLRFTFSIPASSAGFTESISKFLDIDKNKAEELKIKYGVKASKNVEARKVFEALSPSLTDLVGQIKKYISYYKTYVFGKHPVPGGQEVRKIYICGGGANLKGLREFLSRKLKIPVEKANPLINIYKDSVKGALEVSGDELMGYTIALGLALKGTYEED